MMEPHRQVLMHGMASASWNELLVQKSTGIVEIHSSPKDAGTVPYAHTMLHGPPWMIASCMRWTRGGVHVMLSPCSPFAQCSHPNRTAGASEREQKLRLAKQSAFKESQRASLDQWQGTYKSSGSAGQEDGAKGEAAQGGGAQDQGE